MLVHQRRGGRSLHRHHTWSAFGQNGSIRVDRGHVMTVCGQRVRDPPADQSSAKNKHSPHESMTTLSPFILTPKTRQLCFLVQPSTARLNLRKQV